MIASVLYGPQAAHWDAIAPAGGNPNLGFTAGFHFYLSTHQAYAAASTSSVPVLLNPTGSGVLARIVWVKIGVDGGTVVQGALGYGITQGASLSGTSAGPAPVAAYGGNTVAYALNWYTTATSAAAPTFLPMGVNTGGAYAAGPFFTIQDRIDGGIVLGPGDAFYPLISKNAVAATAFVDLFVVQTPIMGGN